MLLKRFLTAATYVQWAQNDAAELEALFQDILAHVTGFFGDQEAFETLEGRIIPLLMKQPRTAAGLEIWVPGCSTGKRLINRDGFERASAQASDQASCANFRNGYQRDFYQQSAGRVLRKP